MTVETKTRVVDTLRRLLNRNATASLRKIVNKTHPADLARAFHSLSHAQQATLFNLIDDREKQGILIKKIDTDDLQAIVESTKKDVFISILEQIPPDDVADLLGRLPEEIGQRILEGMNEESSEEVGDLLQYDDQSAGGIMVPEFIALPEETTARVAITYIQKEYQNVEMTFYLYVLDSRDKLVGVCSLRELVTIAPETPLSAFMTTDIHFVYVDSDQEEVARIVARYDLLAVPVIDHDRKLLGIVTVDDVIDIIRDEATEDILKMVGAGESYVETKSIFKSVKIRLPWLFASCMGGVLATFIIGHFKSTLEQLVFLAAFYPCYHGHGRQCGNPVFHDYRPRAGHRSYSVAEHRKGDSERNRHRWNPRLSIRPFSGNCGASGISDVETRRGGGCLSCIYDAAGNLGGFYAADDVCAFSHRSGRCHRTFCNHRNRYHEHLSVFFIRQIFV